MKVLHVVGARPNFMKAAPLLAEMARYPDRFRQILVHTGQHYDYNMSRRFLDDLEMPEPDECLNVGSDSHAQQTARIMLAFEPLIAKYVPDLVMLVGDVNSTLACALVCAKLGVSIAHVEAGLRSGDRTMPEEINRIVTDQLADFLFTPSRDANENLLREGLAPSKIHFVGNVMIDTLARLLPRALQRCTLTSLGLKPKSYILVTLHRPSNVDHAGTLKEILAALAEVSISWPVIFPVHPRTRRSIAGMDLPDWDSKVRLLDPLGYLDFLALMNSTSIVLTDSGGVQEETTYLGVPCLTVRPNTERPVTLQVGTNRLVASNRDAIVSAVREVMSRQTENGRKPEYWDGSSASRIVDVLAHSENACVLGECRQQLFGGAVRC